MLVASALSRNVAGTMTGSCHSPLTLVSHPQRGKCVQWCVSVTFLLLACVIFLMNVILLSYTC